MGRVCRWKKQPILVKGDTKMTRTQLITFKQIFNKCCKNQKLNYVNDTLRNCPKCSTIFSLNQLKEYKYKPMEYNKFKVYEPKERIIYAPHFRDVIVQHAIYKIIYPIYNKTFIDQSFACRKGMGTHKCSQQTQKYLRNTNSELYTLKLDIRKYG